MKRKFIIYIVLCAVSLGLIFAMSGCAISALADAIQATNQKGFTAPKWDVDMAVPIMSKTVNMDTIFDSDSLIGSALSGNSGQSNGSKFEEVTKESLAEGGKYYFKDMPEEDRNFGLKEGEFVINYEVDFPGTDNMLNGSVNSAMIDQFLDNFVYSIDKLMFWPFPLPTWDFEISQNGVSSIAIPGSNEEASLDDNLQVDLSDLSVDVNGDGANDILLKGIYSEDASLSVTFVVERYDPSNINDGNNGVIQTIIPTAAEVSMEYVSIEGTKYLFDEGAVEDNCLRYTASDFITDASGDHSLWFNKTGDTSDDYSHLDVDGFGMKLIGTDVRGELTEAQYIKWQEDLLYGYKYRLKMNVSINFGDNYDIICDFDEMKFDLGIAKHDLSMLNQLDGTNDKTNLGSYFLSSLSMENAAIYFNASSTMPVGINLSSLFDEILGSVNPTPDPITGMPTLDSGSGDGAIITYFYEDANMANYADYTLLKFDTDTDKELANIPAMVEKSSEAVSRQFGLYTGNSNTERFIERTDIVDGENRRASSLFFVNSFVTPAADNVHLAVRDAQGGVGIKAGLILPISIRINDDKAPMDLLKAFGMDNMMTNLTDAVDKLPVESIKNIGFNIDCVNHLPIGMKLEFLIIADVTIDGSSFTKVVPLLPTSPIASGGITKDVSTDIWAVSSASSSRCVASTGINFAYTIINEDGDVVDNNGDLSADAVYHYDGTLLDFLKNESNPNMKVNLALVKTANPNDPNGDAIAVKLNTDNYLKIEVNMSASATIDINGMMQ